MRALVSGASGFVGGHLVRRLAREGQEVHAILRPSSQAGRLAEIKGLVIHCHDGTTAGLIRIVEAARPEVVFHLASLFVAEHSWPDLAPLIESNVLFGAQLAEAMAACQVTRLVNTGTAWQHYQDRDYSPVCLYAATKQALEDILRFYVEAAGLRVITLKLFDTYGPDDHRPKLFSALSRAAAEGQTLALSPGEQLLDLVHVEDVVEAFVLAARRLLAGQAEQMETYAVSSAAPLPLRQVVETYLKATGRRLSLDWGGRPYRAREVMVPWSKGQRLPGWGPKIGLEEGLG
ncbi:MAG: NAD(P)-dependent oxidoreductase, partial [Deltaproteobacteria bacterium]|nr:NAD(P)-dependent oxidoreductase [Deltaproteobacteria bacterium]